MIETSPLAMRVITNTLLLSAYVRLGFPAASITGSREAGGLRCSQMCSEDKMQAKCMKV